VPIVRDRRLRECDYGALTRTPVARLEALRHAHVKQRFPSGESYEDVVVRVAAWLEDLRRSAPGEVVLVVGHRATFYALEHLLAGRPLEDLVTGTWRWQPGWEYDLAPR